MTTFHAFYLPVGSVIEHVDFGPMLLLGWVNPAGLYREYVVFETLERRAFNKGSERDLFSTLIA